MLNYQSKLVPNWSTLIYLLHAQKAVIQAARPFLAVTNLPVGFSLWHLWYLLVSTAALTTNVGRYFYT